MSPCNRIREAISVIGLKIACLWHPACDSMVAIPRLLREIGSDLGFQVPEKERRICIDRQLRVYYKPDVMWLTDGSCSTLFEFEPRFQPKKALSAMLLASRMPMRREKLSLIFVVLKGKASRHSQIANLQRFLDKNGVIDSSLNVGLLEISSPIKKKIVRKEILRQISKI